MHFFDMLLKLCYQLVVVTFVISYISLTLHITHIVWGNEGQFFGLAFDLELKLTPVESFLVFPFQQNNLFKTLFCQNLNLHNDIASLIHLIHRRELIKLFRYKHN